MPTPPVGPWTARRAEAERRLAAAVGDRSLCDVSRAGAPGGVKELEGRMAALAEVDRAVRGGAEPADAVRAASIAWRAGLDADAGKGPAWAAYRRGGVDELAELSAELADA